MKILFAIKALEGTSGGAERVLADITSGLSDMGHQISLLTFDMPGKSSFYTLNPNVELTCLGVGNAQEKSTFRESMARIRVLRHKLREERPDIIVAFMHSMFVPMAFASAGSGVPLIASEHIVPAHYKSRRIEFMLIMISSFFVDRITVLSERIKRSYPRFLRRKMTAIANPVQKANITANPVGVASARKMILNVGRMDPQKDQGTLIKAFAALASDYPDWDLRIIGEGHLRPELEDLSEKLGLTKRIFIPGSTQDIASAYQNAQIFALSSRYESFGLATAEAMAHGLPAVGFADCPGTNELIIDQENGILAAGSNRVEALSEALQTLMDSPELRMKLGQRAQNSIKLFYPEAILKKWDTLLTEIVRRTK